MEKVLLLRSGKCAWGRCVFCGWGKKQYPKLKISEFKKIVDDALRKPVKRLKIFCSGSFLDDSQVTPEMRRYVVRRCELSGVEELVVESRPEFVTEDRIRDLISERVRVTVAIGLEVADDRILKKLKKGFGTGDYLKAVSTLRKFGLGVRTYILVNAPFTDDRSLERSVEFASRHSDTVCLINCVPHRDAEIFGMWIRGEWKPLSRKEFLKKVERFLEKGVEADYENISFVPTFPDRKWIKGAGRDQLLHPYFRVWQEYLCEIYEPPKKEAVLFVPCTYTKPYSRSVLHRKILRAVPKSVHLVVVSSPGVIPYEFVNRYPFNRYDWPEWEETEEIKKLYRKVTSERIENYLRVHRYRNYFSYLRPDSDSFAALKDACARLGINLVSCISPETWERIRERKNPLASDEAVEDLKRILRENLKRLKG